MKNKVKIKPLCFMRLDAKNNIRSVNKMNGLTIKDVVDVINLSTGKEYTYVKLSPIDALISCSMLENKQAGSLLNQKAREQYKTKIIYGKRTAAIGDLAVIID